MKKAVVYVHGKNGSIDEAKHYSKLFDGKYDVIGFAYKSEYPWDAKEEFCNFFNNTSIKYNTILLIANSIGAYLSLISLSEKHIKKAMLISPIVDMEKLILDMMKLAKVSEEDLRVKNEIPTSFGETLSWKYLCYAREYPFEWNIPTHILYGEKDNMTSYETVSKFADKIEGTLTVMKNGEHWFHTQEQMDFLDNWILENI